MKEFDAKEKELKAQLEQAKEKAEETSDPEKNKEETADSEEKKEEASDPEEKKEETVETEEDEEEEAGLSKEETDALRDSKYLKERLTLDLQILAQQRNLEAAQYAETKSRLSEESAQLSGSSSDGRKVIHVDKGGKLGDDIPELNTTVSQGQYLFTVNREGKRTRDMCISLRGMIRSGSQYPRHIAAEKKNSSLWKWMMTVTLRERSCRRLRLPSRGFRSTEG